jgi:hypothetical protein
MIALLLLISAATPDSSDALSEVIRSSCDDDTGSRKDRACRKVMCSKAAQFGSSSELLVQNGKCLERAGNPGAAFHTYTNLLPFLAGAERQNILNALARVAPKTSLLQAQDALITCWQLQGSYACTRTVSGGGQGASGTKVWVWGVMLARTLETSFAKATKVDPDAVLGHVGMDVPLLNATFIGYPGCGESIGPFKTPEQQFACYWSSPATVSAERCRILWIDEPKEKVIASCDYRERRKRKTEVREFPISN